MGLRVLCVVCVGLLMGCEARSTPPPKPSPKVSPVKVSPSTLVKPVEVAPKLGPAQCLPLKNTRALHKELECLVSGMPEERILVFQSQDDVRRYAKRASATCVLKGVDFSTHVVLAYKATAPCSITVEDSLCSTGPAVPPEYSISMTSQGYCDKQAMEGRFWAIERPKDLRIGLKRQRHRLP